MRIALAADRALYYRWYPAPWNDRTEDVRFIAEYLNALQPEVRAAALTAIGRLQTADNVPLIARSLKDPDGRVRAAAAKALEVTVHGSTRPEASSAADALLSALDAEGEMHTPPKAIVAILEALGAMPDDGHADRIEAALVAYLTTDVTDQALDGHVTAAAAGLEAFTRTHPSRGLRDTTITALRQTIALGLDGKAAASLELTAEALVNAHDHDRATAETLVKYRCPAISALRSVCGWPIRRLGLLMAVPEGTDFAITRDLASHDAAYEVRRDALEPRLAAVDVAGSCRPLVDAFDDESPEVVMRAADLVRPSCSERDEITGDLKKMAGRLADRAGDWRVPLHALDALAVLAPDSALGAIRATAIRHPVWQVRADAARLAFGLRQAEIALALVDDPDVNVRAGALSTLVNLHDARRFDVAAALVAAMVGHSELRDNHLMVTAAGALAGDADADRKAALTKTLLALLAVLTGDPPAAPHETARDARLAIFTRLAEFAPPDLDIVERVTPYVADYDPRVAIAAANLVHTLTGTRPDPKPAILEPYQPTLDALMRLRTTADITLSTGRVITLAFDAATAPIAVARFQELVERGYYQGQPIYRVTDMEIRGGSPDANDDQGADRFARDELGGRHDRGAVSLLTHGLDAADLRFGIDSVDRHDLDDVVTVFAHAITRAGTNGIDDVREGATIQSIRLR